MNAEFSVLTPPIKPHRDAWPCMRPGYKGASLNNMTLASTLQVCKDFGFSEELTREILWNTAYHLGRSRWHWGPSWMVTVRGWINTRWSLLKCLINPFHPKVGWLRRDQ